ncbi:creatininase family protein [Actinopolyspora alba]|uniref:creatininase family protein n=1 Tax=Actinopolyspora alba TaxID=673379 RepID=UPI00318407D4
MLSNITQHANVQQRSVLLCPGRDDWKAARDHAGAATTAHEDMHSGEMETSILLYTRPELVGGTYADADHDALATGRTRSSLACGPTRPWHHRPPLRSHVSQGQGRARQPHHLVR